MSTGGDIRTEETTGREQIHIEDALAQDPDHHVKMTRTIAEDMTEIEISEIDPLEMEITIVGTQESEIFEILFYAYA